MKLKNVLPWLLCGAGIYLAVATDANIPVDFLDEDALEEPEQLAHYKAIFVTQPNVPVLGTRGLLAWAASGGHLLTVSNAMNADEFDEPSREFEAASGIAEPQRLRLTLLSDSTLPLVANGTLLLNANESGGGASFSAYGVRANLTVGLTDRSTRSDGIDMRTHEILAVFADGGVAAARASVGRGTYCGANIYCALISLAMEFCTVFELLTKMLIRCTRYIDSLWIFAWCVLLVHWTGCGSTGWARSSAYPRRCDCASHYKRLVGRDAYAGPPVRRWSDCVLDRFPVQRGVQHSEVR